MNPAALPSDFGRILMERLDEVAKCSNDGPGVTRLPFTDEHRAANDQIAKWMEQAGLYVKLDAAGTLVGRKAGPAKSRTLLIGSHQDTIVTGGKYDGILGIALPILVLEALKDIELPIAVEVLAFADEEGVRFPTAMIGPRVLAGTFDTADLELADHAGIKLGQALSEFGGDISGLEQAKRDPETIAGFLEVHIEQGSVLEKAGIPVGAVSAICGIERWTVRLTGKTAHAGTTPMDMRNDALTGAAEAAIVVEATCKSSDVLGVVGMMRIEPNVPNAIPGAADFIIELRATDDHSRTEVGLEIADAIRKIASKRGLGCLIAKHYSQAATPCDKNMRDQLLDSIASVGLPTKVLASGAVHDSSSMADLCPVGMLFVRCYDGLSHHPDESVSEADARCAADVLHRHLANITAPFG